MNNLVFWWGAGGVAVFLASALLRLVPYAIASLEQAEPVHAWGYLASIVSLGWAEGYRAFQRGFSPRVVARAHALAQGAPRWLQIAAPLVAMGLIHATRRRRLVSWSVIAGVAALVVLVARLAQPWRGIIDAGVVVGLSWGVVAILVFAIRAARGNPPQVSPDFPE